MRIRCFYCGKSVTNELPDDTIFRATAECPECVMLRSPPAPRASNPKTVDPDGTSLPPGADDLQGHGTYDSKQSNPIGAHDTGVYKSCGVFPATEDELRIVRTVTGIFLLLNAASPATPPTGGIPGNGGALKP